MQKKSFVFNNNNNKKSKIEPKIQEKNNIVFFKNKILLFLGDC